MPRFNIPQKKVLYALAVLLIVVSIISVSALMLKNCSDGDDAAPSRPQDLPDDGQRKPPLEFEEQPVQALEDDINQIDFVLSQLLIRQKQPYSGLVEVLNELRTDYGQLHHYKEFHIFTGSALSPFSKELVNTLPVWVENATLQRSDAELPPRAVEGWSIYIDGIKTHTLFLFNESAPDSGLPPDLQEPAAKMAVVIDDMGESKAQAQILLSLDFPVTFAIWPYSSYGQQVARMAANDGAEVIVHQPMEPMAFPEVNPGKGAILSGMSEEEVAGVIRSNLSRYPQASGLNNHMGSRLTQNERIMGVVAREAGKKKLFVLDSRTHPETRFAHAALAANVTVFRRDVFLDVVQQKDAILAQLRQAERIALLRGQAIVIGHPYQATLEALEEWQQLRDPAVKIVRLNDLTPLSSGK